MGQGSRGRSALQVTAVGGVGILLCLSVTACSGSGPAPTTPDTDLPRSAMISGAYANPLDAIMFPDETQQSLITTGLEQALTTCMAEAGYTYHRGDAIPGRRTAQDAQYTYSVTDPAVAAEFGFHPASWVAEMQDAALPRETPPPGYEEALFGHTDKVIVTDDAGAAIASYDPDSCLGRARDELTPDWARQDQIFFASAEILLAVSDALTGNEEFRTANARWSQCMAESGYEYATPMDANNDPRFGTDFPTVDEFPVAIASATCQHSSGLLETWSRLRAELTQDALDKQPGIVTEWLSLQQDAYSRVSKD